MRTTKSARTAMERMVAAYAKRGITVRLRKTDRGFEMRLKRPGKRPVDFAPHKLAHQLAILADLALMKTERGGAGMTRAELADELRLNAAPKANAGWQQETLEALAGPPRGAEERKAARRTRRKAVDA